MSENIVIIGAVALGPKAACRLKRLKPEANVVMVDQTDLISYGGCGIPYFVSGDVSDIGQLQSTSFHMLRDKKFFQEAKGIEVLTNTRAVSIDRVGKKVLVKNMIDGKEQVLSYDKLVLATGSRPRRLPIPGAELPGVFTVSNLHEAEAIKAEIAQGRVDKAVVIGAGAIGLEMAEALADLWGIETAVIEVADQVLPGVVSPGMARMVRHHLEEKGVKIYSAEEVVGIEGAERVERVVMKSGALDADLVIMAVGVVPNGDLAGEAGLELSPRGAIKVDERLATSDPNIFAGGDCVEIQNLLTGKAGYFPSGSLANREGRVIGSNLAGENAVFEGAVGTFAVKLFELSIASAGLSMEKAIAEGFDPVSVFVVQFDRSHFYPDKDLLYLELVVEKGTGKVLGVHGLGGLESGMFARVSAIAAILKYRPSAADISNLEFPYSPHFLPPWTLLTSWAIRPRISLQGKTGPSIRISLPNGGKTGPQGIPFSWIAAAGGMRNILSINIRKTGKAFHRMS